MTTAYGLDARGHTDEYREAPVAISYRYGYQVADAKPRFIGKSSDRGEAVREAKKAAEKVRAELRILGAPSIVTVWIQQRKRTVAIEFSEPETVAP